MKVSLKQFFNPDDITTHPPPCAGRHYLFSGVYLITFSNNPKVYVGSTGDYYHRRACHLHELNTGKHYIKGLQRAYDDSHTGADWEFAIVRPREKAYDTEQQILDLYFINVYCVNVITVNV